MRSALRTRTAAELLALDLGDRQPLLGSWLKPGHLSMVYAPTGLGKSFLCLSIALAVAGGGRLFGWKAPAPRPVLFVDGEMDLADLQERIGLLLRAVPELDREVAARNLRVLAQQDQEPSVRFPDLANPRDHRTVFAQVERDNAALVVLDNYSTLATVDDENAASSFNPVMDLMRGLRQRNAAAILVHHARKNPAGDGSSYRGTSKMGVLFTSIIKLSPAAGVPVGRGAAFTLTWEKSRERQDGFMLPLDAWLADGKGGQAWEFRVSEAGRLAELVRLVRSLSFATQDALAQALGITKGTVSKLKARAIGLGLIGAEEWSRCLKVAGEVTDGDVEEPLPSDLPF